MSLLEIRHEFFDVEARNNEQLFQAFCNHVHLAQWELSRVCLQILFNKRLQLNTNLEELLADIIRNPTAYCTGSNSILTPFHFALLLVEECRTKQYLDVATIESLKYDAIFKFLLAIGDVHPSAQVIQDFYRIYQNTDAIPSSLLTDTMADFLVDLWRHEIPRAHALVRLYLHSSLPSIHLWLIQIHKRALDTCLSQLQISNNKQHEQIILADLLLALHFYGCDTTEFRSTMRSTLKQIVIYASTQSTFDMRTIYRCVLNNGHLARLISELEGEYRREMLGNETVMIHFLKKNSFRQPNEFWKELYLYLIENKLDLSLCVLNDATVMIQNRDYTSFDELLSIEELVPLHLCIFLLGWTHVRVVNDAIVFHDSINSLNNKSPMLSKCLQLFQSHIDFITWLFTIRRVDLYSDGISPLPNMSDLLASLQTNSPLSLIYRYLDVPTINSQEILEQLRKTSVDIDEDNERQTSDRKRVRFTDYPANVIEPLRLPQTSAAMLFLGYLSINSVVQRILSSSVPEPTNDELFATTKMHLSQIFPLRFRLELLENIYSLIFIQQSELKLDETIGLVEPVARPAAMTTSMSLPSSEKFLSSLHSNISNESLQASTGASIKTQMSNRRIDDEVDDDNDDHQSVCSSSMSSLSTSQFHSMYKSGLLIDQQTLYQLLLFLRDQIEETKALHEKVRDKATDRDTVEFEMLLDKCFIGCSINTINDQFNLKVKKLKTMVSETLWRYTLLTANTPESIAEKNRSEGDERNKDTMANNTSVKNLILPLPVHRHSHRRRRRNRLSESSASSVGSSQSAGPNRAAATIVPQILSTRDNLLAICLKEGKITEANDVIRLFNMQSHPLAVEATFSKLFRDTVLQLYASHPASSQPTTINSPSTTSPLAGLHNLATSALGNSSLQSDIEPLLNAALSPSVSSTLPTSPYFDHDHFASLTLFDLAINAPSMSTSKTLLDMAQHRLPLPRPIFSPTNTNSNNKSSSRIKSLSDMILNYSQLTSLNSGSLRDTLLDVTLPLDSSKTGKIVQYFKRLDEHCRRHYDTETNPMTLEQQVKAASELFDTDPQARLNLVAFIRNGSNQNKLPSSSFNNYFAIFHTYLQNFRALLEKFPVPDISVDVDLAQYSPISLVYRIVARSTDIDLAQLQHMTSKLNIDISLAVSLNIIRPLLVDKTMPVTVSSNNNRRVSLLQQHPLDIFSYRQQQRSMPNTNQKRQGRRSTNFFRRLTSKGDDFQSEQPDRFIRTILTKLLDSIRKILQDTGSSHMTIEHADTLINLEEYDDILNALPLLACIDLARLISNDERLCFFVNLYNLLMIISHIELIRSNTAVRPANLFRDELERLLFLTTTRVDIGQLKRLSLFDLRHLILSQNILIEGLKVELDREDPLARCAPFISENIQTKLAFVLTDCTYSSSPFVVLTPELVNEQLQRATRDFIDQCVSITHVEMNASTQVLVPNLIHQHFIESNENLIQFLTENSSNNDLQNAIKDGRSIVTEVVSSRNDFALTFDYRCCAFQAHERHRRRRTSSLPSSSSTTTVSFLSHIVDFIPPPSASNSSTLPNHLIDSRTIAFVQEKSPALGQILKIYVQSVVHNETIESSPNSSSPLQAYFASLLLSPSLVITTSSFADEWFRSIALNDLAYQHDLLLHLCSILWNESRWSAIVELFDSLLPSFVVHSAYFHTLRDLALLSLVRQVPEPDMAYRYLRKIRDCHLLIRATLTYLPRFDGPTCLNLLQRCLTSCKKSQSDYVPWIQMRLNTMYVYKTLCLGALDQFNKCMKKIAKEDKSSISIEDLAIKKTSAKCLTWQRAQEHSQLDPLAVADMFIVEEQFDMGHKWLLLLTDVDEHVVGRVRLKLVEEHVQYLLKEDSSGNGEKILQIIDTIHDQNAKWQLCSELFNDLSRQQSSSNSKAIPFSRLFIKFRLIQYMLAHFEEISPFFTGTFERSTLAILVSGLALFFNCVPLEQTDFYVQLVDQPLLIVEQLLMNSSIDVAKITIESLNFLIEKYALKEKIPIQKIDQLIEFYTRKSVQLNVGEQMEEVPMMENKSALVAPAVEQLKRRRKSATPLAQSNRRTRPQESSPLGSRQASGGTTHFLTSIRKRMSPKTSISSPSGPDHDQHLSSSSTSPSSIAASSPPVSIAIPIKPQTQTSSFLDYFSSSLSSRSKTQTTTTSEFTVPIVAPSKELWISDTNVSVCMCCNETIFSMFNRRHHCRRCGRVVCNACSDQMTLIHDRLERTCKHCYHHPENQPSASSSTTVKTRTESMSTTKKHDSNRLSSRPLNTFKRQSISQAYLNGNRQHPGSESAAEYLLFGTSLANDPSFLLDEEPLLMSSSFSTTSPFAKPRQRGRTFAEPALTIPSPPRPTVSHPLEYQLSGTTTDQTLRNDFHYDTSPSISLCLSLIELHSDQYQCGKLLLQLCEYLSEKLSTKQRNIEIDYGLVLNIIKNLLFTAKMKLMTMIQNDDDLLQEQHKLVASCDMYINLVDILNRLNMVNCALPALNDLQQQDTLRRIRNQLLEDERYQLAMDISTRCSLDTHTIWFQWGMAYLHIGQYDEARDKFDKCLKRHMDSNDTTSKQQHRGVNHQDKILGDIINYLESCLPLNQLIKSQFLAEQQVRQADHTRASLKYLTSLSTMPKLPERRSLEIYNEIHFYLTTYSDDAHVLDYFIRQRLYSRAFEHKCSASLFRDHIYLPLLKRNHLTPLFDYITSRGGMTGSSYFANHLKVTCSYLKDQKMFHSLKQLQLFMHDYVGAGLTSIDLFHFNRTTYIDLFEKRLEYLQKALEFFQTHQQQPRVDYSNAELIQNSKSKINLQIELTRYVHTQLQRLGSDGGNVLVNCPTLFGKTEAIIELIGCLLILADAMSNVFGLVNKILNEFTLSPTIVFVHCAKEFGKRRDYRSLQQLLQLLRENGYTDVKLHDDIIDSCIRQTGSDVEQSREQDTLIQMIKNDDARINVCIAVGKLRAAYLIAIRLGKEDAVRLIQKHAQQSGQTAVNDICTKWLDNRAREQQQQQ